MLVNWKIINKVIQVLKIVSWFFLQIDHLHRDKIMSFKIASKLTSIVTIFANIALAGNHIFQYLLNTCAYYQNSYKYCHNICKYWASEYTLSISLNNTYDFRCGNCFYMRVSFFVTFANMFGKWIEFLFDFSAWQWGMYAKIKSCKK